MQSLKIGHVTHADHGTGVSVFLFDQPANAAYILCGSSPASRELGVIELDATVQHIDALVFSGGSAFGLAAVDGVMRWLQEKGRGFVTPAGAVPIVPTAGIYDLGVKGPYPPTPEDGYEACAAAIENNPLCGRIGVGTGASVGKLLPNTVCMSGGFGHAQMTLDNGVTVAAYAVVNSLGDVRDAQGNIIAGAKTQEGEFADCEKSLLAGMREKKLEEIINTTLVAVFTNASFSRQELKRIAKVALGGMARAISPVFTRFDGDIIFSVSLGDKAASEVTVSAMAAEMVRQAIVNAIKDPIILEK
jgi:L-aminopeptidase/D-esterase-like protein